MKDRLAPTSLATTVIRGVSIAGGGYLLTQTLRFGSYVALARLATPRDFGQLAAGAILIEVGALFAESGMLAALIQRRDRIEEAANTALVATVLAGFGLAVVALAASPLIGLFFRSHEIGLVAAAMSGYLVLRQSMIVPDALMQRRFSFVRRVVLEPAGAVAFGTTAVIACANGMGVWGLVLGTYASVTTQAVLSWSLVRWRPKLGLASIGMWRELVRFGKHVVAGEIVRRGTTQMSTVLLGRFVGTGALGQYQYAYRVAARPLDLLVSSTSYVLFPAFARMQDDYARFRAAFLRALRWVCVLSFPASLLLLPLGPPLVVLVFGRPWQDAGYALSAMCAYTAGQSFVSMAAEVFKAAGRPSLLPRMHLVAAGLTAGFMLALLPLGLLGIAAALSLRAIGVAVYAVRKIGRVLELPVSNMVAQIWPPAVAATAMAGTLFPLERLVVHAERHSAGVGLALVAAEVALGVVVYLALLTIAAPTTGRDLRAIVRVLPWRLGRRGAIATKPEAQAPPGSAPPA